MKEIRYPRDFSQSTLNEFQATFRQGINVMWVAVVHKVLYCYCLEISGKKAIFLNRLKYSLVHEGNLLVFFIGSN